MKTTCPKCGTEIAITDTAVAAAVQAGGPERKAVLSLLAKERRASADPANMSRSSEAARKAANTRWAKTKPA